MLENQENDIKYNILKDKIGEDTLLLAVLKLLSENTQLEVLNKIAEYYNIKMVFK